MKGWHVTVRGTVAGMQGVLRNGHCNYAGFSTSRLFLL